MKQRLSLALSAAAFVVAVLGVTPLGQAAGDVAGTVAGTAAKQARGSLQAIGVIKRGPRGPRGHRGPAGPAGPKGATGTAGAKGATGVAGAKGAKGATGTAGLDGLAGTGLRWRGPFECGAEYARDDAVEFRGSTFVTNEETGGCAEPPNAPWELLASGGTEGSPGARGEQGAQGPTGVAGQSAQIHGYAARGSGSSIGYFSAVAIVSVNLPAGTFIVNASADLVNSANYNAQDNSRLLHCWLRPDSAPEAPAYDGASSYIPGPAKGSIAQTELLNLDAGTTLRYWCWATSGASTNLTVTSAAITAIKLDQLN